MIGLLERAGLQERARTLIAKMHGRPLGPLLIGYLLAPPGHLGARPHLGRAATPRCVRPLVAPMAEGAAESRRPAPLDDRDATRSPGHAAATDNIGLFFGEDIFIAIGSILLMKGFLDRLRHHHRAAPAVALGDPDRHRRLRRSTARACWLLDRRARARGAAP